MSKNQITINHKITLDFGGKQNRRRPFSWGRAARRSKIFALPIESRGWDTVLNQSTEWTHHLTINIDPKLMKPTDNDPKVLKSTLKSFFLRHDVLATFTTLTLVLEYGKRGKWHAHALLRCTQPNVLKSLGTKEFSKLQNIEKQTAFILRKDNTQPNQKPLEETFICTKKQFVKDPLNNFGYLRKEKNNKLKCDIYINKKPLV